MRSDTAADTATEWKDGHLVDRHSKETSTNIKHPTAGRIYTWTPADEKTGVKKCLGMFLGFSKVHSSLAPPVLNLATGMVTVCFHAIFDDDFTTVSTVLDAARPLADAWADIFQLDGDREVFLVPEEMADESGCMVPLDPVWCPQDVTGGSF